MSRPMWVRKSLFFHFTTAIKAGLQQATDFSSVAFGSIKGMDICFTVSGMGTLKEPEFAFRFFSNCRFK